jgi:molybdate-binding protein/DNA-binding XRE family transcriptional regulator
MENKLKVRRLNQGWSQAELADRAGISRTAVTAIEGQRLVPSVAAALSLAAALDCSVEELFGLEKSKTAETAWAWPPPAEPCRYWHVEIDGRTLLYPVEATPLSVIAHDGIFDRGSPEEHPQASPDETLVMASCDPAVALLASQFARATGFRLIAFPRSSEQALALLGQGLVHMAGVHLSTAESPERNAQVARTKVGANFRLVKVARWQEGVAVSSSLSARSLREVSRGKLRWVGREPGSGARQCLDELLHDRPAPRRLARDHRGVAEAVRCGWADAGVCVRLVSEEAGLRFLSVCEEAYDLCFPASLESDPRVRALVKVIRSTSYRRLLGQLPGYDTSDTGEVQLLDKDILRR